MGTGQVHVVPGAFGVLFHLAVKFFLRRSNVVWRENGRRIRNGIDRSLCDQNRNKGRCELYTVHKRPVAGLGAAVRRRYVATCHFFRRSDDTAMRRQPDTNFAIP
jgi:hypothetical protein